MELLTSKKFQTSVVSPLMTYIVSQGLADHGKEKAKVVAG